MNDISPSIYALPLDMYFPHKAKWTAHSVLVSLLATEGIMPFCWLTSFCIAFVVSVFLLPAVVFVAFNGVRPFPSMQVYF
jgi:hypothetical protein